MKNITIVPGNTRWTPTWELNTDVNAGGILEADVEAFVFRAKWSDDTQWEEPVWDPGNRGFAIGDPNQRTLPEMNFGGIDYNWRSLDIQMSVVKKADLDTNGNTDKRYWQTAATIVMGRGPFPPMVSVSNPRESTLQVSWVLDVNDLPGATGLSAGDPNGILHYEIGLAPDYDSDPVLVANGSCAGNVSKDATTCDIDGVASGQQYIVKVRAVNAFDVGDWGETSIMVIGPASAPQNLAAQESSGQVDLTWGLPTNSGGSFFCNGFSYEVEQSSDGNSWESAGSPIALECPPELAPSQSFSIWDPDVLFAAYTFRVLAKAIDDDDNDELLFTVASGDLTVSQDSFDPNAGEIEWGPPTGLSEAAISKMCSGGRYVVEKSTNSGGSWTEAQGFLPPPCFSSPSQTASVTVSGLENGTPYFFRVRAVGSVDGEWATLAQAVTPATVPDAPTSVTATRGDEEVLLSWTPPVFNGGAAITDYEYEVSSDGGDNFGSAVAVGSAATSVTVPDLTNGDTYVFRVTAINSVGSSTVSVVSNEATPAALPAVPTKLSATAEPGQVVLSWKPGTSSGVTLTGHLVELSTDGGVTWSVAIADTGSVQGSATVTGLTNGTDYRFRVSGISSVGTGLPLALTSDVTPSTTPGPISNLQATAGDGQAVLTWTAGNNGGSPITGYKVEKNDGDGWTVETAHSLSVATTYTVTDLTNETAYRFRVTPINANGSSVVSPPELANPVTPVAPPGVPGTPTATAGPGAATVTVAAGTGGTPASYVVTADPGGATCTVTGASGSCTITGLTAGTDYTFTATATNGAGTSQSSTASTTVTPTVVVVTAPAPNSPGQGNQGPRRGLPAVVEIALQPRSAQSNLLAPVATAPRPGATQPGSTTPGQAPSQATTPSGNGQSAATSGPLATVGGQVVTIESTATSPTQLALQVGSVSLGVSVGNGSGTVGSNGSGANGSDALGIQLANGAATVFEGGGLTPGSAVQVVLPLAGDNSAVLAVIEVAEDGTFLGEAAFSTTPDGDPLPIGVRVVQLFTVDEDGNDVVIEVAVTIGQPDPAPVINRADGSVPALTPGEALGTSAGLPQVIEVRAIEEQKRAVVDGGDWSMAVDVASSTGGVQSVDSGAQLTLVRDESAMVSGSGFMAGTRADVWLFSEPTLLGTVTVDENGEFVGEVTIDGIVIPPGDHTLQLQGVGQDGYVKATSLGVAVDDVSAPRPADTTSSSLWMLLLAIGGLAILLIAVFIVAVRRQMRKQ